MHGRTLAVAALGLALLALRTTPNVPVAGAYRDCPADGSGGDPALNALCNRVETAATVEPLTAAEIGNLPSPGVLTGISRGKWTPEELKLAQAQESRTVRLEGYVVREEQEMLVPWNCNQHYAPLYADLRIWVAPSPAPVPAAAANATAITIANQKRLASYSASESAILCVISPRWRAANPDWSEAALKSLAGTSARIRVTGDLLYAENLAPLLLARPALLTLWTIHPVTDIEIVQNGVWTELGSDKPAGR